MKNPLSTSCNVPFIRNFEADTDVAKLSDAVKKIIAAHPSINIHFELRDDEIMQVINKPAAIEIPIHALDEKDFAAFKNNFVRPFKLEAEPLYRIELVKTPAQVSLFIDFHHLIFDGASMNLFLSNLKRLLEGGKIESVEEDFCKIFGSILQLEDVGTCETFFDLGGTSLLVTRVVIMAQKLGYKINFADVLSLRQRVGVFFTRCED